MGQKIKKMLTLAEDEEQLCCQKANVCYRHTQKKTKRLHVE